MVKRAFTLIELIIVIVVSAILALGTMVALKEFYLKSLRVKQMTILSIDSQIIVDKVAALLYNRIPSSALGYNPATGSFKSIYDILDTDNMRVFEWYGEDVDLKNSYAYSGFIDFENSDSATNTIFSPDINATAINAIRANLAIIFSGAYDMGDEIIGNFVASFGWHGSMTSNEVYTIANPIVGSNVVLNNHPNFIFEKYYIVNQAYAIARGEDLNITNFANCANLGFSLNKIKNFNNALFLFYGYRPWRNETFCADSNIFNGENRSGRVALLSQNVTGFNVLITPSNELKFNITMQGDTRGSDLNVTISKQKIIL